MVRVMLPAAEAELNHPFMQGPLLELQTRLKGYVKPGGLLLLSGILQTQVRNFIYTYWRHRPNQMFLSTKEGR